tara:strand:+ start:196 stop:693 length:498 start_codon:yes stop_codon:yes gene_type:complete
MTSTIRNFLIVILVAIGATGYASFKVWKDKQEKLNKKLSENEKLPLTFKQFMNGSDNSKMAIIVGMASGVIFGFIDNFGLFTGMSILDPILKKLPGASDPNVFAGYGNTFSDAVGAFLGTFGGRIISDKLNKDEYPIWTEAVGIIIGCLIGIVAGKFASGKKVIN